MKKLIKPILVIGALLVAFGANAQCPINTTTTDWSQYNPNDPAKPNNFNWTVPGLTYPIYLQDNLDNPSRNIELPYFCTQAGGSGSCGNKNTLVYELAGNTAAMQDINPADGWELVLKNFGTVNTALGNNTGRGVADPFFVLYNRYTGRMKTFVAVMGIHAANSALIKIELLDGKKKTALFSHAQPVTKTLENFDNTNFFKSLNDIAQKNNSDDYYWLVSEIQTAYDPCACQRPAGYTDPSIIVITPKIIASSNITATIEGTTTQQITLNGEDDKKSSFKDLTDKAISGYNTWNTYKDKTNSFLNDYNQNYKNKLINDWFDQQIRKNPTWAGAFTTSEIEQMYKDFKSMDENVMVSIGVGDVDMYNETFSTIKGIASTLPYVGAAIGVIEFFSGGGKAQAHQPPAPMVFNSSFKLNGSITTETKLSDFSFHNPGTRPAGSQAGAHLTPFYDNVLGVFNVINSPAFRHFKIEPTVFLDNTTVNPVQQFPENDWDQAIAAKLKQYQITETVKYAINPAANLDVEVIDVAFVFEYSGADNLFIKDPNDFASSKALPYYPDIHKDNTQISLSDRLQSLENAGIHLDYVSANYPAGGSSSVIRLRTPYVPLKCLANLNFVMFGTNAPKVGLKLLVKMKRNNSSTASGVTQIITYDLTDKFTASTEVASTSTYDAHLHAGNTVSQNLISRYTNVTYVSSKHNGLPIDNIYQSAHNVTYNPGTMPGNINATGDITIPNNTVVPANRVFRAYGKIIVGTNVTFGNNVELRAGEKIEIPPNNVLNPTMIIVLEPLISLTAFNCTSSDVVSLKASQTEINNACASNNYLQSSGQQKMGDIQQFNAPVEKSAITECLFYPNPVTSTLYVNLKLDSETEYTLEVTDIAGKQLYSSTKVGREGKNLEGIDVSGLSGGVYFVKVNAKFYSKTDKFIVIK